MIGVELGVRDVEDCTDACEDLCEGDEDADLDKRTDEKPLEDEGRLYTAT